MHLGGFKEDAIFIFISKTIAETKLFVVSTHIGIHFEIDLQSVWSASK
jgi:hypothetical protein